MEYVDGLATHWNLAQGLHPAITDFTKSDKKDLFLLGTETSKLLIVVVKKRLDFMLYIFVSIFENVLFIYKGGLYLYEIS